MAEEEKEFTKPVKRIKDIEDEENRLAAEQQIKMGKKASKDVKNQLDRSLSNYDMADDQNRRLAEIERIQNDRDLEADRFEAQRALQNAALGLSGSMNQAWNGSSAENFMRMMDRRNDAENQTYWTQYQKNMNSVNNAYQEALNANNVARNDALANAEKSVADIEGDTAANIANLGTYQTPGSGDVDFGSSEVYKKKEASPNYAEMSGYVMPSYNRQRIEQRRPNNNVYNNSSFARLMNRFNGR